jgi:ribosomal protein S18 acetylase RimI-like enzyme
MIRLAASDDLPVLVGLMRGYYRDDGLQFDENAARAAMQRLLAEPQWGRVWLAFEEQHAIGYMALCIGFSLELGGNDAFIDEVFVLPEFRGRGWGRRLLEAAGRAARELNVRAIHLEVDRHNESAQRLYRSLGYGMRDRYILMTLRS